MVHITAGSKSGKLLVAIIAGTKQTKTSACHTCVVLFDHGKLVFIQNSIILRKIAPFCPKNFLLILNKLIRAQT